MNCCVYTALLGDYEKINEQPIATQTNIPFICLTDNPKLKSNTWEICYCKPLLKLDSFRSQRAFKMLPHNYLPEFDVSIYIDNTVLLTQTPDFILNKYFSSGGFSVPKHSFRKKVIDEFHEVAITHLDRTSRLLAQLKFYLHTSPSVLFENPFWNGILIRENHHPTVKKIMELWFSQVLLYSRRDQLSLNYSIQPFDFLPFTIEIDNYLSDFHIWPHLTERNTEMRFFSSDPKYFEEESLLLEMTLPLISR